MAELPEICKFCTQLENELRGRKISGLELLQPKNLNVEANEFVARCVGSAIDEVQHKGKWIIISLDNGENILISLGMGCDLLYHSDGKCDTKYQIMIRLCDGGCLTLRFWWFGRFILVSDAELSKEPSTTNIAMDPFDKAFTYEYFRSLFNGKKTQLKSFLLDQKNIGGIGNMYMHDILFDARQHPQKKISNMTEADFECLYQAILTILTRSAKSGAFCYEKDIYGNLGGFSMDDFLVGYKEGAPCPLCGTPIELIKTGSTSSYICPKCQLL